MGRQAFFILISLILVYSHMYSHMIIFIFQVMGEVEKLTCHRGRKRGTWDIEISGSNIHISQPLPYVASHG